MAKSDKKEYTRCLICNKRYVVKKVIRRKGILKGMTITNQGFCSKNCSKIFKLLINVHDIREEIEQLRKKCVK